jgi:hypothetical protein
MNEKGIKILIRSKAREAAKIALGVRYVPLVDLAEEVIQEDLGYLDEDEQQIYKAVILTYYRDNSDEKVPPKIYRLLQS